MDQVGRIEKLNGDTATILVKRVTACGDSCAHCSAACKQEGIIVQTQVPGDLNVGDYVEITTENEVMLKHILVLYGTPFVLLVGTIALSYFLLKGNENRDLYSAIVGLSSLIGSHFILKKYDKSEALKNTLKYTVTRKL
jgi:sigma-E factor negative regulatory protein RseC